MTGRIIPLPGDPHREIQALLPWYVSGRLQAEDYVRVKAHLEACAECRAEVEGERSLTAALAGLEPVAPDVDRGWAAMREQIRREAKPQKARRVHAAPARTAPWLGWALAGQFCLLLVLGGYVWRMTSPPAHGPAYHALGGAPRSSGGNIIVIFGPETREAELREILQANNVQLVGGPTAAGAYVLAAPAADRDAALVRLRQRKAVVLAQPIDPQELGR